MSAVTVRMKDGTVKHFPETWKAGGSWSTTLRTEPGFAVIQDAFGEETWIPNEDIATITKESSRRGW